MLTLIHFIYLKEHKVGSAASFPAAAGQPEQQTAVDDLLGLVSEITAIQVLVFFLQRSPGTQRCPVYL